MGLEIFFAFKRFYLFKKNFGTKNFRNITITWILYFKICLITCISSLTLTCLSYNADINKFGEDMLPLNSTLFLLNTDLNPNKTFLAMRTHIVSLIKKTLNLVRNQNFTNGNITFIITKIYY